jgi:hypothetical protein
MAPERHFRESRSEREGIQRCAYFLDSRLRGNDVKRREACSRPALWEAGRDL